MLALFRAAATALTRILGEPATYAVADTGKTLSLRAVSRRDVNFPLSGMDGVLIERRTVITLETAALSGHTPARGDLITVEPETWKVLAIERDDGYLIQLKVVSYP